MAERLATYARVCRAEHPGLRTLHADAPYSRSFTEQTLGEALKDIYNSAQLDVVGRTEMLLRAGPSSGYLLGRNTD